MNFKVGDKVVCFDPTSMEVLYTGTVISLTCEESVNDPFHNERITVKPFPNSNYPYDHESLTPVKSWLRLFTPLEELL